MNAIIFYLIAGGLLILAFCAAEWIRANYDEQIVDFGRRLMGRKFKRGLK